MKLQFNLLFAITIAMASVLSVTNSHADSVYVLDWADHIVFCNPTTNSPGVNFVLTASNPLCMAFDSAGNLYVANHYTGGQIIEKYSPSGVDLGEFASTYQLTSGDGYINGMAFDGANNLYVSITVLNWIIKITTNGVESVFASSGAGGPIVFDSSGNLYSAGDTAIEKISPSGVDLGKFTSGGLNSPSGLAFDRAGNFYVSNGGNTNKIEKFNSAGVDQGIFTTNGLSEPGQMAFDSGGNLYVGDDNKVEIYNSSGQLITYGSVYTPATIDIQPGFLNRPILVIPSPQLSISLSTTNVILSWPTNAAGFTLQTTTNLVSPATWTTVSTTPVVVNTNNRVTNSFFGKSKFYRLSQ